MAFNTSMPMFWGDYLRDTGHLSAAEHGAYLMLIAHQWTTAKPLPDDDAMLARITRMAPREWRAARRVLIEFFSVTGGCWSQKRVAAELDKARETYERRSAAGAKGGSRAKAGRKPGLSQDEAGSKQPVPEPVPSPSPTPLVGKDSAAARGVLASRETSNEPWVDLADQARALGEIEKSATPMGSGIVRQWFADGVKISDLVAVIPKVLAREREKRRQPDLVLPLEYYTNPIMDAMRERVKDLEQLDELEAARRRFREGNDAA